MSANSSLSSNNLTLFEKQIFKINEKGEVLSRAGTIYKPVVDTINGKKAIIGYYKESFGYSEMRDREGRLLWSDEKGIEPSLFSPIDLIGPALVSIGAKLVTRGITGVGINVARLSGSRALTSSTLGRVNTAIRMMKQSAAKLLVRKFASQIQGPLATVSREALKKAMNTSGSRITLMTRLTHSPQVGRALSASTGQNAKAIANTARTSGRIYTAQVPKALIVELEKAGLVQKKIVRMGSEIGTEYRFLEKASEFIVKFFK